MPEEANIPENKSKDSEDYKRIGFMETLKISKWGLSIFLRNHPLEMAVYILTTIIRRVQDLIYTLIFAKTLDQLIVMVQEPGTEIDSLYPYLLVLLGYSVFETIVSYFNGISFRILRTKSRLFLRREMYFKLKTLGIQTLEQPEVNNKIFRSNDYIYNILPYMEESVGFLAIFVKMITTFFLVVSFMPSFILIILAVSLPYLFIDKKFRRDIYKLSY